MGRIIAKSNITSPKSDIVGRRCQTLPRGPSFARSAILIGLRGNTKSLLDLARCCYTAQYKYQRSLHTRNKATRGKYANDSQIFSIHTKCDANVSL